MNYFTDFLETNLEWTFCWVCIMAGIEVVLIAVIRAMEKDYQYGMKYLYSEYAENIFKKPYKVIQAILECYLSNTLIMSAVYVYEFLSQFIENSNWWLGWLSDWLSIFLIFIILAEIKVMNFLDRNFDLINKDDKNVIRLFSSIMVILLFILFVFNGKNNKTLLLYIGLVLGRFVFFDTSFEQTIQSLKKLGDYIYCISSIVPLLVYVCGIDCYDANQLLMSQAVTGTLLIVINTAFWNLDI